jgi:hypothetical protein
LDGVISAHGKDEKMYIILIRNLKGRELGKHKQRLEDNIKVRVKEIGCDDMDWIRLAQHSFHLRAPTLNFRFPQKAGNFVTGWVILLLALSLFM